MVWRLEGTDHPLNLVEDLHWLVVEYLRTSGRRSPALL